VSVYIYWLSQFRLTHSLWRHLGNSTGIWSFKMVFVGKEFNMLPRFQYLLLLWECPDLVECVVTGRSEGLVIGLLSSYLKMKSKRSQVAQAVASTPSSPKACFLLKMPYVFNVHEEVHFHYAHKELLNCIMHRSVTLNLTEGGWMAETADRN
jgi:hypothetical protein